MDRPWATKAVRDLSQFWFTKSTNEEDSRTKSNRVRGLPRVVITVPRSGRHEGFAKNCGPRAAMPADPTRFLSRLELTGWVITETTSPDRLSRRRVLSVLLILAGAVGLVSGQPYTGLCVGACTGPPPPSPAFLFWWDVSFLVVMIVGIAIGLRELRQHAGPDPPFPRIKP